MKRGSVIVLALVLLLSISTGVFAESKVLLYTSVPLELATNFADQFMKANKGIKVEVFRAGSTDVVNKIWAEADAGGIRADVIWLADAASYYAFKDKGLLYPYKSPEAARIPSAIKDPDGYFTGARMINMVIGINTNLVKKGSEPKTWDDLLGFGSRAAMADPLYSGSNFTVAAAFVQRDKGWSWYEKARKSGIQVLRGNSDVSRGLAAGEFAACMVLDYMIYDLQKSGAPVDFVWPADGAVSIPSPVAIVAGSKNLEASKAFVDFTLSKKGQELLVNDGVIPVRPDVAPPKGMPTADKIKMMPVPFQWAADNASAIRETFEKIMFK
ncbi:MAG TPA: ABC transporter substrate-binding protein [Bacillota bacterium]|jgi:iron(III) transport system substrate-binding protein|nr:ABC transporter substrate-binding protein [Bacillota bacterium]HOB43570.1 ABC transporter substrate-binding protein [Bacillota bacterium]HOK70677.1 ABC transporter substrate-binding protein [Bacillota bacterium]HOL50853.1 ABC transporter substrate-binding protein [Bacillota bacterium]HOO31310.1 ABC transporter substrate-binding protein [Bacillota bacterium]